MFTVFHRNKLRYNKGQLMPLFIAVLAVIIIMAMVTINISKVAQFRTEASNGVDAGALAGGSVLAGVFNQVSQSNQDMYNYYILFVLKMTVSFGLALGYLAAAALAIMDSTVSEMAAVTACPTDPCWSGLQSIAKAIKSITSAMSRIKMFNKIMLAISIAYAAYKVAQAEFYQLIRDMAEKGWKKGIQLAHNFNFTNSKTGSKLKSKKLGALEDGENSNNYYDTFSDFMDGVEDNTDYTYSWTDGQGRGHNTHSKVYIQPVDDFKLTVMITPFPLELIEFILMYAIGYLALADLAIAGAAYAVAAAHMAAACACMTVCCPPPTCPCPACILPACVAAGTKLLAGFVASMDAFMKLGILALSIPIAALGLSPLMEIDDTGAEAAPISLWTICWIQDINHDRLVKVWQDQHHDQGDLGIWKTQYPDTQSYSCSDISGNSPAHPEGGTIYPYGPYFDPSIVDTDKMGGS